MNTKNVFGAMRRHPVRTLAVCVPLVAVSVFTGTTMASAQPEATMAVSPSQASAAPTPYASSVGSTAGKTAEKKTAEKKTAEKRTAEKKTTAGKTRVVRTKRDVPVKEPVNIDGCDHDYGVPGQCIPWHIPASSPQAACAWLQANGYGPLKVYGTNRQNLPENSAGYVCATGT